MKNVRTNDLFRRVVRSIPINISLGLKTLEARYVLDLQNVQTTRKVYPYSLVVSQSSTNASDRPKIYPKLCTDSVRDDSGRFQISFKQPVMYIQLEGGQYRQMTCVCNHNSTICFYVKTFFICI